MRGDIAAQLAEINGARSLARIAQRCRSGACARAAQIQTKPPINTATGTIFTADCSENASDNTPMSKGDSASPSK